MENLTIKQKLIDYGYLNATLIVIFREYKLTELEQTIITLYVTREFLAEDVCNILNLDVAAFNLHLFDIAEKLGIDENQYASSKEAFQIKLNSLYAAVLLEERKQKEEEAFIKEENLLGQIHSYLDGEKAFNETQHKSRIALKSIDDQECLISSHYVYQLDYCSNLINDIDDSCSGEDEDIIGISSDILDIEHNLFCEEDDIICNEGDNDSIWEFRAPFVMEGVENGEGIIYSKMGGNSYILYCLLCDLIQVLKSRTSWIIRIENEVKKSWRRYVPDLKSHHSLNIYSARNNLYLDIDFKHEINALTSVLIRLFSHER